LAFCAQFQRLTVAIDAVDSLARGPAPVERVADLARDWHAILDKLVRREGAA
jgi:hypothetical protein